MKSVVKIHKLVLLSIQFRQESVATSSKNIIFNSQAEQWLNLPVTFSKVIEAAEIWKVGSHQWQGHGVLQQWCSDELLPLAGEQAVASRVIYSLAERVVLPKKCSTMDDLQNSSATFRLLRCFSASRPHKLLLLAGPRLLVYLFIFNYIWFSGLFLSCNFSLF